MAQITIPAPIQEALEAGAALAISVSGGKDSQAMLQAVVREYRARPEWTGELFAVHADLGRAEWHQTNAEVRRQCEELGIRLEIVERTKGDLVQRFEDRMNQLEGTGKPFWASAANRYCTSDLKRDPIDKLLRRYDLVVSAEGIRAEESSARSKKATCELRKRITAKALRETNLAALAYWNGPGSGERLALTWRPIHQWLETDVWDELGYGMADVERRRNLYRLGAEELALEGWHSHPAYVFGNERLSCALCVLASRNDLENGARHNPETFALLLDLEVRSGFTFRQDLSLAEIAQAIA